MKLTVIGTGYVGLCQGAAFADIGHDVTCVDIMEEKIVMLNNFKEGTSHTLPIFEPGLPDLIQKNANRLTFTTSLKEGLQHAQVVFIAVGTPPKENGEADLTALRKVTQEIAKMYENTSLSYLIVVNKSTVPVGTYKIVEKILKEHTTKSFDVVSNPEFLAQGRAVKDCVRPSRIVIGTQNKKSRDLMVHIYQPYERQGTPVYLMNNVDAELHKYAANSYLAAQVSLTNNLANLARIVGADWNKVKEAVLADKRVGRFVHCSPGFGGSCFEKDVEQLTHTMQTFNADNTLLKEVLRQNMLQKQLLVTKIKKYFGDLTGKTFAIWGLSFKPETNDMRGAPSIPLIKGLVEAGAQVKAYDPVANSVAEIVFSNFVGKESITYVSEKYDALEGSDALIIMTEWREFRTPDFEIIKQKLTTPLIFDGKDIYIQEDMIRYGIGYSPIGKPDVERKI